MKKLLRPGIHALLPFHLFSLFFVSVIIAVWPVTTWALSFPLPPKGENVVGELQQAVAEPGDDFHSIGRRYDIGYYELVEANPTINPDAIAPWTPIVIPSRFILPDTPHEGIVVSLAELRLYYYPPAQNRVITYPIGIGREGWQTPVGIARVIGKKKKPTWVVPDSIRADAIKQGNELPRSVPPGPDNPLGEYALRLSLPSYLIHGTNRPAAIGTRSTAGCIRVFPEDIEKLFEQVPVGAPVRIIDPAYKVGWEANKLYLEAHLPLQEQQRVLGDDLTPMVVLVTKAAEKRGIAVDWDKAQQIVSAQDGMPHVIAELPVTLKSDAISLAPVVEIN